jgi:hypothetical protein
MLAKADGTGTSVVGQGQFYAQAVGGTPATYLIKSGKARCVRLLVPAGTGSITVYDGTDNTGTLLWTIAATTVGAIYETDIAGLTTGLYVVPGASTTVTVVYT